MTTPSSEARSDILERLRHTLTTPDRLFRGQSGDVVAEGVPMTVTDPKNDSGNRASRFGEKLESVLGSYEIVTHSSAIPNAIVRRIRKWRSDGDDADPNPETLSWDPTELPVPHLGRDLAREGMSLFVPVDLHDESCRVRAARAGVGITGVDAAFASTGSALLVPGKGKSRVASLLPLHHLMLVPISRIYPTFEDWLRDLRRSGKLDRLLRDAGQIVLVTGPSKSADIEMNMTVGVHGPRHVHAIIFDDRAGK